MEQQERGRLGQGLILALQRGTQLTDLAGLLAHRPLLGAGGAGGVGGGAALAPSLDLLHEQTLGAAVFAELVLVQTGSFEDHAELVVAAQGGRRPRGGHGVDPAQRAAARQPGRVSLGICVAGANAATDSWCGASRRAVRWSFSSGG